MKKILILCLIFAPSFAFAAFESDLSYGSKGEAVVELQEFLADQGLFEGVATGNFYSLTQSAVRRFQLRESIAPAAGYFGPKTRARANDLLSVPTDEQSGTEVPVTSQEQKGVLVPLPNGTVVEVFRDGTSRIVFTAPTPSPAEPSFGSAQVTTQVPVQVEAPKITSITVTNTSMRPAYSGFCAGGNWTAASAQFRLTVLDQFGKGMPNQTIVYSSTAAANKGGTFTTDTNGIAGINYLTKDVTDGTVTLTFSVGSLSTTTSYVVKPLPIPNPAYC